MYCVKQLNKDLYWVGGNDRRLALFENVFPIPRGVSYNAYLVLDEKPFCSIPWTDLFPESFLKTLSMF